MKLRLIALALLLPLTLTVCAWAAQAAPDLLPTEPWLRALAYLGSIGCGGYLLWWLTRWLAPRAIQAITEGFDRIVRVIEDRVVAKLEEGFGRVERKLDEVKESQSSAHRDQFREIREIAERLKARGTQ